MHSSYSSVCIVYIHWYITYQGLTPYFEMFKAWNQKFRSYKSPQLSSIQHWQCSCCFKGPTLPSLGVCCFKKNSKNKKLQTTSKTFQFDSKNSKIQQVAASWCITEAPARWTPRRKVEFPQPPGRRKARETSLVGGLCTSAFCGFWWLKWWTSPKHSMFVREK